MLEISLIEKMIVKWENTSKIVQIYLNQKYILDVVPSFSLNCLSEVLGVLLADANVQTI